MGFTVRKAIPQDAEALAKLYLQFWEVHTCIDPLIQLKEEPTLKNQIDAARKSIKKRTTHLLVATENDTVIGYMEFCIKKNEDCFTIAEYGYVDACVIDKKYRRKGVARKLTQGALQVLKEKGITYVKTNVYNANEPGRIALQKLGFTPLSTIMMKMV
jgi:ribosomal protein S18 acetylase RimI-like enzyme